VVTNIRAGSDNQSWQLRHTIQISTIWALFILCNTVAQRPPAGPTPNRRGYRTTYDENRECHSYSATPTPKTPSWPGDDVTLCTYHAWFAEPIDLQHSHWRPASCIRTTNIPYSQLISLIKLGTNSHHLDIERLRHARPRVPRSRRACPWCRTPNALHDELHCTLECPHLSNTRLRYPTLFGAGQVGTDMRTLFTAEHLAAPMASFGTQLSC
jgi:hypothetical protein